MRISDCSSDVCSSDLAPVAGGLAGGGDTVGGADHDDGERVGLVELLGDALGLLQGHRLDVAVALFQVVDAEVLDLHAHEHAGDIVGAAEAQRKRAGEVALGGVQLLGGRSLLCHASPRSEEQTSELQSLMRISYAVFCLKKKQKHTRPSATQSISRT